MKKIVLVVFPLLLKLFVISCTDDEVLIERSERSTFVNGSVKGFGIAQNSLEKLSSYLVIFDFDDTLYMNGDQDPANVQTGWSNYADDAIKYLHKNGINIAICSKNNGENLPSTLRGLNSEVFNNNFFTSLAFLDGTPDATKGGMNCHNPKDQGVKDIIEFFEISRPSRIVMFDDADYNKEDIEGSQLIASTGVAIKDVGFVQVEKRENSANLQTGGGVTEQQFTLGLSMLGILDNPSVTLLKEGEGDCDNSRECAGGLVCMNQNGQREEADSNDHGFTFQVENDVTQDGGETCQQAQIPLLKEGEGDCDNSRECAGELVCMNPNGKREEKDSNEHGFTFVIEEGIDQPGDETCQQAEAQIQEIPLLEEGEGDCDNSLECAGDLVCMNPNGEREEKDSNGHGFTFVIENDSDQAGDETCQLPGQVSRQIDESPIKFASNTLVVKHNNQWHYVYCSSELINNNAGRHLVKISNDPSKKQFWRKSGDRNIKRGDDGKPGANLRLYCPENRSFDGRNPTICECKNSVENYHEKRKEDGLHLEDNVTAPASITPNKEIYSQTNQVCIKNLT